jgi:hypothetical protein
MISKPKPPTIQYGFKQITLENILVEDSHPSYPTKLKGNKWVLECLKPKLESNVPEEVAFLFEMARGSMIYGLYFLPLATIATEQGFRVLEAGARYRCKQLGLLKEKANHKKKTSDYVPFADLVSKLNDADVIPAKDLNIWKSMVFLRNSHSHGETSIRDRKGAMGQLSYIADLLNQLFK